MKKEWRIAMMETLRYNLYFTQEELDKMTDDELQELYEVYLDWVG